MKCFYLLVVGLLHGDLSQGTRNEIITKFKKKEFGVLVATDVAGKFLDKSQGLKINPAVYFAH
mgnify:FL=1